MNDPLLLPVLSSRYPLAWPGHPKGEPIGYQAAPCALRQQYATDAHTAGYSAPSMARRLDLGAAEQMLGGVVMVALFVDVDGAEHKADPAWRAAESSKITAALAALPGGFAYQTRGGYRMVWRLASPITIASADDYANWRLFYWRALLALSRRFGIEGDPLCTDWTRLYRLPHATRDEGGKPEDLPTEGDPELRQPLALAIEATDLAADLAEAERLHSLHSKGDKGPWKSAVERLAKEIRGEEPPALPPARPLPAFVSHGLLGFEERELCYVEKALENEARELALTGRGFRNAAARDAALRMGHYAPHLLRPDEIESTLLAATRAAGWADEAKTRSTIQRAIARGMHEPKRPTLRERDYTPRHHSISGAAEQNAAEEAPPASGPVPRLLGAEKATEAIRAALRSPAPLVVLRSTTGAGKSAEVRQLLAEQASAEHPAALFVPTHRLGEQTQQGLSSLGVSASRPLGVARVHLLVVREGEDPRACIHHEAAELLAQAGGHVREELCSGCTYRKAHPKTGAECPAYASGASRAPVVVLQQPLLADTLATAAEELTQQEPEHPPLTTIIVDELPPLVSRVPWTAAEMYKKLRLDTETNPEALEGLGPLLDAIAKRIRSTVEGGVSLRQILAAGGSVGADIERTLEDARAVDPRALWKRSLPVRLALRAMNPTSRDHALARLAAVAAATGMLRVLIEAAHEPDRPLLWCEETGPSLAALAPWVRQVRPFLAAGGKLRLLDATAPSDALRSLWPELELHAVEVRDTEGIQRRYLVWQHGARGRHTAPDRTLLPDELRGPLRRLAAAIKETGARAVGLLTHKPLADGMREWLLDPSRPAPDWCPEELAALVAAGVELRPGHYGAQRGLDTWADVDVLATVGDPWANLGASTIEAAVLGIEAGGWALETARAELVQAWGRARPVHRPSPCTIVHLGAPALAPSADWAPQWVGVKQEWPQRGRPPTVLPLSDPATWAEERARLGLSRKAHAEALGLSWRTYRRKEPKGTVEGGEADGTENDQETSTKDGGHNPQEEVSSGVAGNPAALSSLIPDYAPPDSCGFVATPPSTDPPSAPVPSGVHLASLDGPFEPASARRPTPGGLVARAPGRHEGALVA